jgi:rhodanese-related sulfurtransferase
MLTEKGGFGFLASGPGLRTPNFSPRRSLRRVKPKPDSRSSKPALSHNPATLDIGCLIAERLKKGVLMAHQHPPRFLKIVDDAKTRVRETNVEEVKKKMDGGEKFILVDVREESEFAKDHLPEAIHLGKGIIERDIEARVPDLNAEIVLYCGGGFRSALAADNLQKMGYTNVISMDGGIRDWREKGYPLTKA